MLEDAINQIAEIIKIYPEINQITITSKNNITFYFVDKEQHSKTFTNSVDLLEWCEENLKSPLDEAPKNKIVSFFYRIVKKRNAL
jgi:hypothetical protein